MGAYDGITPEELRASLIRAARLVIQLEEEGSLLAESPGLLELFGELRQMLFAYEVRCTGNLLPPESEEGAEGEHAGPADTALDESLRIVREAVEREQELQDELRNPLFHDDDQK